MSSNSLYRASKNWEFLSEGINVASPCFVPSFVDGTCKGAVHFFATVSQCLLAGMLSRPLLFLCPCGTRIHTTENRRKCPVASDSGITRKPKIPIIFYCSGTIRAGRSCRSISRGRTSVFGPGSGGTPSRRTIRRGGRHKAL